jgi:hypothetical protein
MLHCSIERVNSLLQNGKKCVFVGGCAEKASFLQNNLISPYEEGVITGKYSIDKGIA